MATASFSVTSSQHTLSLDGQGHGEGVFTVTNSTDLPKRAQLKVYAQVRPITVDSRLMEIRPEFKEEDEGVKD